MMFNSPHARVPVSIARNPAISPQARCLFLILASYADVNGTCWPSRRRLSNDLGFSVRTVATLLGELERAGILRRRTRLGRASIFQLQIQPPPDDKADTVTVCTGADEPGLANVSHSTLENIEKGRDVGSDHHERCEVYFTGAKGTNQTSEVSCTGQGSQLHATCEAGFTGGGSTLHEGGKDASYRTNPLNYATEPILDTEAESPPTADSTNSNSHPPDTDPWKTRNRFDPAARWPAFDQIRAYALRSGVPEMEALSIWESYTATGWVDRHGNPIRHWGMAVTAAWRYREESRTVHLHTSNKNHPFTQSFQKNHDYARTRIARRQGSAGEFDDDPGLAETFAILREKWRRRDAGTTGAPN